MSVLAVFREPSKPRYQVRDHVKIRLTGELGEVRDIWTEAGPIHWYTIRLEAGMRDFAQDEIEDAD